MFIVSLFSGIIGIVLGWEKFYNETLSKTVDISIWLLLLVIFVSVVVYIWRPQKSKVKATEEEFEVIEGQKFGIQQVNLDGRKFINCKFNGTELLFSGENGFHLHGNDLTNIPFSVANHAAQTIVILQSLYKEEGFRQIVEGFIKDIQSGNISESIPANTKHAL
jgi:hypothetical protein